MRQKRIEVYVHLGNNLVMININDATCGVLCPIIRCNRSDVTLLILSATIMTHHLVLPS